MCCHILESLKVKSPAILSLLLNFPASSQAADNHFCFEKQESSNFSRFIFRESFFQKMLTFLSRHLYLFSHLLIHGRSSSLLRNVDTQTFLRNLTIHISRVCRALYFPTHYISFSIARKRAFWLQSEVGL